MCVEAADCAANVVGHAVDLTTKTVVRKEEDVLHFQTQGFFWSGNHRMWAGPVMGESGQTMSPQVSIAM